MRRATVNFRTVAVNSAISHELSTDCRRGQLWEAVLFLVGLAVIRLNETLEIIAVLTPIAKTVMIGSHQFCHRSRKMTGEKRQLLIFCMLVSDQLSMGEQCR